MILEFLNRLKSWLGWNAPRRTGLNIEFVSDDAPGRWTSNRNPGFCHCWNCDHKQSDDNFRCEQCGAEGPWRIPPA